MEQTGLLRYDYLMTVCNADPVETRVHRLAELLARDKHEGLAISLLGCLRDDQLLDTLGKQELMEEDKKLLSERCERDILEIITTVERLAPRWLD